MPEINLTPGIEALRFVATDPRTFRAVVDSMGFLPDDSRLIATALGERGVTLQELLGLVWNAAVCRAKFDHADLVMARLSCFNAFHCTQNVEIVAHDAEEVPF